MTQLHPERIEFDDTIKALAAALRENARQGRDVMTSEQEKRWISVVRSHAAAPDFIPMLVVFALRLMDRGFKDAAAQLISIAVVAAGRSVVKDAMDRTAQTAQTLKALTGEPVNLKTAGVAAPKIPAPGRFRQKAKK